MKFRLILLVVFACWMSGMKADDLSDSAAIRINKAALSARELEFRYQNAITNGVRSFSRYMDELVNLKLQVEAAEDFGLDTTRIFRDEMQNFRQTLSAAYLLGERNLSFLSAHEEEDSVGKRALFVRHIFKYLPQNVLPSVLQETKALMDSLHVVISQAATDSVFNDYVQRYSDEKEPFWVNYLEMPSEFEDVVFKMKEGEISRPFFTPQGIHIVQVKVREEPSLLNNRANAFLNKLQRENRIAKLVAKLRQTYHLKMNSSGVEELKMYGKTSKIIFMIEDKSYSGLDFARFISSYPMSLPKQIEAFIMKSVLDYADAHLEQKNPSMCWEMEEHRDSVLSDMIQTALFSDEVLSSDTVGLERFYDEHRSKYYWDKVRYKGAVLQCVSKRIARRTRRFLKSIPVEEWEKAVNLVVNTDGKARVKMRIGVFAVGDNPHVDKLVFKKNKKEIVKEDMFPVAVVIGEKIKGPESPWEVGHILLEDYRAFLKQQWLAKLHASAKVEINQEVIKTVNKH